MITYTQMGGEDRAEVAGTDIDGWKFFSYIIDGRAMDIQNAYRYLCDHKGMTAIEASKFQLKLIEERVEG